MIRFGQNRALGEKRRALRASRAVQGNEAQTLKDLASQILTADNFDRILGNIQEDLREAVAAKILPLLVPSVRAEVEARRNPPAPVIETPQVVEPPAPTAKPKRKKKRAKPAPKRKTKPKAKPKAKPKVTRRQPARPVKRRRRR